MVYFASNATAPATVAGGPQTYQNPYYKTQCGCGSSFGSGVTLPPREGFTPSREGMQVGNGPQQMPPMPMGPPPAQGLQSGGAPMCTLTATAPPAGCCHPAPLHCDCCNGSGYFRASEAYGS